MSNEQVRPEIGMGATMFCGSDCYPYTIVDVSDSGKRCWVQRDEATRIDDNGYGGQQEYNYERDPEAPIEVISLRKDGSWKSVGGGNRFAVGFRRQYYDPSF